MYCVALTYIVEYIFKKRKWDINYELNTATSKISYPLHLFQSVNKHFHELYRYILFIEMHMIVLVDDKRI